jgi:hypothetical protein
VCATYWWSNGVTTILLVYFVQRSVVPTGVGASSDSTMKTW